jgi:hypothetical protein
VKELELHHNKEEFRGVAIGVAAKSAIIIPIANSNG